MRCYLKINNCVDIFQHWTLTFLTTRIDSITFSKVSETWSLNRFRVTYFVGPQFVTVLLWQTRMWDKVYPARTSRTINPFDCNGNFNCSCLFVKSCVNLPNKTTISEVLNLVIANHKVKTILSLKSNLWYNFLFIFINIYSDLNNEFVRDQNFIISDTKCWARNIFSTLSVTSNWNGKYSKLWFSSENA